ncbi:MAG: peptide chain release factor N(5)-glutamine methyltransferase [Methylophilaceae bacterium]
MLISQQLQTAKKALSGGEASIDAQALMRHALGDVSRAWLIVHEQDEMSAQQQDDFATLLQRRLAGEPISYILGMREFYGLEFKVTPAVLIPRPDTETLVETALGCIPPHRPCRVLDLGTGSGAIAIAIAHYRPQAEVLAVDTSSAALDIAKHNTQTLNTPNVRLLQSDWFSALQGEKFDVIVSNPPYIAAFDSHLTDLGFEPATALISGADGLDDILRIVAQAPQYLNTNGWLLLEHGYDQASAVVSLLEDAGFTAVGSVADLGGVVRVTLGRK